MNPARLLTLGVDDLDPEGNAVTFVDTRGTDD